MFWNEKELDVEPCHSFLMTVWGILTPVDPVVACQWGKAPEAKAVQQELLPITGTEEQS